MRYAMQRLRERSTWAGLTVIAGIVGWKLAPETLGLWSDLGMAIAAVVLTMLPEQRAG